MMSLERITEYEVSKKTLEAFRTMWGLYPAPVLLLKSDRQIVAVNTCAQKLGIKPGIRCFEITKANDICRGCLANEALRENKAKHAAGWKAQMNQFIDGYWIPVDGEKDLYVHFGNDITAYVKDQLCG